MADAINKKELPALKFPTIMYSRGWHTRPHYIKEVLNMEFRTAIVDELGAVMFWCDQLQGKDQIECILAGHPEWSVKAIEQ